MKTLLKFAFKKSFLILVGTLCLILLILRLILPVFNLERAELKPTDFSVIGKSICYLGRGNCLLVFENGIHVDTLTLSKELRGYDRLAVLHDQILFNKDGTVWQSTLELSDIRECANQKEARERLEAKKQVDRRDYRCIVKLFYGFVEDKYTQEKLARMPVQDSILRATYLLLGLVILVHGCCVSVLLFRLKRNSNTNQHPNMDD